MEFYTFLDIFLANVEFDLLPVNLLWVLFFSNVYRKFILEKIEKSCLLIKLFIIDEYDDVNRDRFRHYNGDYENALQLFYGTNFTGTQFNHDGSLGYFKRIIVRCNDINRVFKLNHRLTALPSPIYDLVYNVHISFRAGGTGGGGLMMNALVSGKSMQLSAYYGMSNFSVFGVDFDRNRLINGLGGSRNDNHFKSLLTYPVYNNGSLLQLEYIAEYKLALSTLGSCNTKFPQSKINFMTGIFEVKHTFIIVPVLGSINKVNFVLDKIVIPHHCDMTSSSWPYFAQSSEETALTFDVNGRSSFYNRVSTDTAFNMYYEFDGISTFRLKRDVFLKKIGGQYFYSNDYSTGEGVEKLFNQIFPEMKTNSSLSDYTAALNLFVSSYHLGMSQVTVELYTVGGITSSHTSLFSFERTLDRTYNKRVKKLIREGRRLCLYTPIKTSLNIVCDNQEHHLFSI